MSRYEYGYEWQTHQQRQVCGIDNAAEKDDKNSESAYGHGTMAAENLHSVGGGIKGGMESAHSSKYCRSAVARVIREPPEHITSKTSEQI